jgi:hypothetical protein
MSSQIKDTDTQSKNKFLIEELKKSQLKSEQLEIELWSLKHEFQEDCDTQEKKIFKTQLTITKMIWACHFGDLHMCKLLLKHGSDDQLNKHASNQSSPLAFACETGNLEIAQWLVENSKHSDVNKVDDHGRTPLFHTLSKCEKKTAEWLVSVGASLKVVDIKNLNLLHVICMSSLPNNQTFELFIWLYDSGLVDIREKNKSGETLMMLAIKNGNLKICKWLFQHGAHDDVRTPNLCKITPLIASYLEKEYKILKWLLTTPAVEDFYDLENERLSLFEYYELVQRESHSIEIEFIKHGLLTLNNNQKLSMIILKGLKRLDSNALSSLKSQLEFKIYETRKNFKIFRSTILFGITQKCSLLSLLNLGTETNQSILKSILEFSDILYDKKERENLIKTLEVIHGVMYNFRG